MVQVWKTTGGGGRADVVILEEEGNYIFGDGRGIMKRCVISFLPRWRTSYADTLALQPLKNHLLV